MAEVYQISELREAREKQLNNYNVPRRVFYWLGKKTIAESELKTKAPYEVRRRGAKVLALAGAVSAVASLAAYRTGLDHDAKPVKATTATAPVVCKFSDETFNFVPNHDKGDGWFVAAMKTEGASKDATCFAQEVSMLEEKFGTPQENLNLTNYPDGYPVPLSVHRETTTTTSLGTVPQSTATTQK